MIEIGAEYLPEVRLPIVTGHLAADAVLHMPRQSSVQTWFDIVDAGVRLTNYYILHGPGEEGRVADVFDLIPAYNVDDLLLQATELACQRLIDAGKIETERVAPWTQGALYKAIPQISSDEVNAIKSRGSQQLLIKKAIASRLIDSALFPVHEAETFDTASEFAARYLNPAYAFFNSFTLHVNNDALKSLAEQAQEVNDAEADRIAATLAMNYEHANADVSPEASLLAARSIRALLRGTTISALATLGMRDENINNGRIVSAELEERIENVGLAVQAIVETFGNL
jgi:hypothetical protein